MSKPKLYLGRPTDKSYEAFVQWVDGLSDHLGIKKTSSDEKKREAWRKFWADKK
jgi:hypothetical protein